MIVLFCPSFVTIILNTYRIDVSLFIAVCCHLRGDLLAMTMHAFSVLPLINACVSVMYAKFGLQMMLLLVV